MTLVRTAKALKDIEDYLYWSLEHFGKEAAHRYKVLLAVAISEVRDNPTLIGSNEIEGFSPPVRKYHIRHSRQNASVQGLIVKQPRHFILYRVTDNRLQILRVLHDQMDIDANI